MCWLLGRLQCVVRVSSYSDEPFAMKCLVEDLIAAIFLATSSVVPLVVSSQHMRKGKPDGKAWDISTEDKRRQRSREVLEGSEQKDREPISKVLPLTRLTSNPQLPEPNS